jgi:tRNA dimethylallyltransferase
LVVIVGQTASGKTALALELAEKCNGEIICADSKTIYKGMDIGTAKPTPEERARVPHHCLDLIDPDETFSAAEFKRCALDAIQDISRRGKLPIMVGGTGLYIDAVLFNYQFGRAADMNLRAELSGKTVRELQEIIRVSGYAMPENAQNKRYLIRAIERHGEPGGRSPLRPSTLVIGLSVDPEVLKERIAKRVDAMLAAGFIEEYEKLQKRFPESSPGFLAPGYKAFRDYLDGQASIDEAKTAFIQNDWQLARRQRTWFKRNDSVQWITDRSEAVDIVTTFLNK